MMYSVGFRMKVLEIKKQDQLSFMSVAQRFGVGVASGHDPLPSAILDTQDLHTFERLGGVYHHGVLSVDHAPCQACF